MSGTSVDVARSELYDGVANIRRPRWKPFGGLVGRRFIAIALSTALVLTGVVGFAGPASASVSCGSKTKHWAIRDGSVDIRVGWVELTMEVCTDGNSITQTSASVDGDTTGPGDASGFDLHFGGTFRTSFNSGGFSGGTIGYMSKDTLRDCLPYILTFCGSTETYYVHGQATMQSALVTRASSSSDLVVHGRVFKMTWVWKCTNSVCGVRLA